jgi:hypothetical protein
MRRLLARWAAPLLLSVAAVAWPSPAAAQPGGDTTVERGVKDVGPSEDFSKPPPALPYAAAVLCAIAVLVPVCMPSRKHDSAAAR